MRAKLIKENFPDGSKYDINAPWNQDSPRNSKKGINVSPEAIDEESELFLDDQDLVLYNGDTGDNHKLDSMEVGNEIAKRLKIDEDRFWEKDDVLVDAYYSPEDNKSKPFIIETKFGSVNFNIDELLKYTYSIK